MDLLYILEGLGLALVFAAVGLVTWAGFVVQRQQAGRSINLLLALGGALLSIVLPVVALGVGFGMPHSVISVLLPPATFLVEAIIFLAWTARAWYWPSVAIAFAGLGAVGFVALVGLWAAPPYEAFQQANARCGHEPVIAYLEVTDEAVYAKPGDPGYDGATGEAYYCSSAEAEAAGYSPQP